jgi:hypothetical protein
MAAGDTTQGHRLPDGPVDRPMALGDYLRDEHGVWWCCVPKVCENGIGNLRNHQIEEHEDGTITVSPSILLGGSCSWHGYLKRGVWTEV